MFWQATFEDIDSFYRWADATDNLPSETVSTETMMVRPPDRWGYDLWFKGVAGGVFLIPNVPFDLIRVTPATNQLSQVPIHLHPRWLYQLEYPGALEAELAAFGIDWKLRRHQPFWAGVAFWSTETGDLMRWVQHGPIVRRVRANHFREEADTVTYLEQIKAYADEVGTVSTKRWRLWQLEQAGYMGYIVFDKMVKDPETKADVYYFVSTHPKFKKLNK
jgi:hypothetical protein